MSINHYSSDHWWSHYVMDTSATTSSSNNKPTFISNSSHFVPTSTATFWLTSDHHHSAAVAAGSMVRGKNGFNLNNEDEEGLVIDEQSSDNIENCNNTLEQDQDQEIPREPLFEKPLTPSDVGKLNRLVIPKQHAEKHFPLNGGGGAAESGENGLLLSFEDEVGKSWRFRYSYWNSSQSYVLTKGWSRFVKEKRLDAGDIVVFLRHRVDAGRFFIGWRRRNSGGGQDIGGVPPPSAAVGSGGSGWNRVYFSGRAAYNHQGSASHPYQADQCVNAGSPVSQNQTTASSGNSKRLRLFGVNLECQADESEPYTPVGSPMSSLGQAHQHPYHQYYYNNHMDISFSGADVYRQG